MIDRHQTPLRRHRGSRPVWAVILSLALSLLMGVPGLHPGQAAASSAQGSRANPYLGAWNYDLPDRVTMTNIATLSCPPSHTTCTAPDQHRGSAPLLVVPQIGYVIFSQTPDGAIVGHTDQGCTWRFEPRPGSLELTPPSQYCFNHIIGSGYTITRWSVTVAGRHEREAIVAVSHLPSGNYEFRLGDGRRTKVPQTIPHDPAVGFVGRWTYDVPQPQSQVNIVTIQESGRGGMLVRHAPEQGVVTFTTHGNGALTAHAEDGCTWTLAVRGNTAELAPAVQACRRSKSTVILRFWSLASDGRHQDTIMSGVENRGGSESSFSLIIGALTRR